MLKAIVILPGTALVYIPALIVWATWDTSWSARFPPGSALAWIAGCAACAAGLVLMGWSMGLFATRGGGGTPAPWDPVRKLVIAGPYRYVRNPMLSGVCMVLLGEAILLRSWPILAWLVFFVILNTVYFIRSEEPGLKRRFGNSYRAYRRAVPRWLPRFTPYDPD